ncbi:monoglyceride lipase-like [Branchiostoma lanceolatum]|uniref:monoglyceride lipase-like n=1 Tax=Branchiostoma lanceolatum TaxID=7740 RepID=UPI003456ED63
MASSGGVAERCTPQGVSYNTLPHMVNADGQYLFCKTWEPDLKEGEEPRALLFHVHGFRCHCGLISPILARLLNGHGILVFSHDHVGHGQSEGIRGDQMDFDVMTRDVLQHVEMVSAKYPGVPVFLSGQSMGGPIAIRASIQRPDLFAGMLLLSPAIRAALLAGMIMMSSIGAWLLPEVRAGGPRPLLVSKRPESQTMYANDPLIYKEGLKLRAAHQLLNGIKETRHRLHEVECPFLVLHGENDSVTDICGSRELYEQARSQDKQIKTYPNCLHNLLLESPDDVEKVQKDILDWLLPRVDRAHTSSS